tara:strand:+ start:340 stop:738 length:399 start_codon:yes stop_codon:yes gene_type:complete
MTEDQLQKQVADYLKIALPDGSLFHHSPNEGKKHINFQMKLKSFGMQTGFPDIVIFAPETKAIFIELKRQKPKGRLTHHQKLMKEIIENLKLYYKVCYNLYDVYDFLSKIITLRGGSRFVELSLSHQSWRGR